MYTRLFEEGEIGEAMLYTVALQNLKNHLHRNNLIFCIPGVG
jgi:hypothetical protein